MDLHALRLFRAVLDEGGFARAAAACHLTQPAVSQAVRRLERELGQPLLARRRPPEPTAAGRRVHALADDLLGREAAARRDLDELRRGRAAVLRLGASQALARELLPGLLRALHARRPLGSLHVETRPSRELVRAVAEGRLELGLGPFQKHMPGLTLRPLGRQRMVLYVGRGSAVARALRRRGADALVEVPLVTSQLDAPGARPGGGRLRDRFRTVWEVHSLDLRLELIRDGLAAGYLPESTVRHAGLVRALLPVDWLDLGVVERQVGFFHLAARAPSELARELLALAAAAGREVGAERARPVRRAARAQRGTTRSARQIKGTPAARTTTVETAPKRRYSRKPSV